MQFDKLYVYHVEVLKTHKVCYGNSWVVFMLAYITNKQKIEPAPPKLTH